MRDFFALYARHRQLGYSHHASLRLTRWCLDASQPLYPENK